MWHRKQCGVRFPAVPGTGAPLYSLLLKQLACPQDRWAWWWFVGLPVAAACWMLSRPLAPQSPSAALLLLNPVAWLATLWGQYVWIRPAFCGGAILLLERGRAFRAGPLLSRCPMKPRLLALIPLAPGTHRKWHVLAGGAAGGAGLHVHTVMGEGMRRPQANLPVLANSFLHRDSGGMPNLPGLCQPSGGVP